ncbi:MAG: hypothetical protein HY701_11090 [Gemmatimonadetes bacterium]|nr:hypothetical protein [Gemmatimonadota bacterium]
MCAGRRSRNSRNGKAPGALALGAAVCVTLAGCDSLLDVSLPGATPAEALDDPAFAPILITGVQGDFECAYTNYVYLAGVVNGELIGAQTFLGLVPYQRRDVRPIEQGYGENGCGSATALYTPISIARFVADDAFKRINAFSDAQVANRARLLAQAALYAGYSHTVFGEGLCSAAFDGGPEVPPAQVFQLAKERFTKAIELATQPGDNETLNAAYVGRARVQLSLGETPRQQRRMRGRYLLVL